MAKYSYTFKKQLVDEYLTGGTSYKSLETKYQLDKSMIRRWVEQYKTFGDEGLVRSREKPVYTHEFKLNAVQAYLTSEDSYLTIALQLGMREPATLVSWVTSYRDSGPEALRPRRRGRPAKLSKKPTSQKSKTKDMNVINFDQEKFKRLEEENYRLRIELAVLKESRRLRLEKEAQLRAKLKPSSASGTNLD